MRKLRSKDSTLLVASKTSLAPPCTHSITAMHSRGSSQPADSTPREKSDGFTQVRTHMPAAGPDLNFRSPSSPPWKQLAAPQGAGCPGARQPFFTGWKLDLPLFSGRGVREQKCQPAGCSSGPCHSVFHRLPAAQGGGTRGWQNPQTGPWRKCRYRTEVPLGQGLAHGQGFTLSAAPFPGLDCLLTIHLNADGQRGCALALAKMGLSVL